MGLFKKRFSVRPNHIGLLYKQNKFYRKLEPGIFKFYDWKNELELISISITSKLLSVTNQEVLTMDNIALRFSYVVEYKISDPEIFASKLDVFGSRMGPLWEVEQFVHNYTQVYLREQIRLVESEVLNEKRNELLNTVPDELAKKFAEYGIKIENLLLKDITFPKFIQNLFSKQLEAKIRAKADLENARTAVATARALKNASNLMKDDDNIKFFQFMETITKIAQKGNHTFMIGDFDKLRK